MAVRAAYRTGKDRDGDIASLCSNATWSPRSKAGAIFDIESGTHRRYVPWKSGST